MVTAVESFSDTGSDIGPLSHNQEFIPDTNQGGGDAVGKFSVVVKRREDDGRFSKGKVEILRCVAGKFSLLNFSQLLP